ncbi:MFS transporter [Chloroflexota bacterium]
MTRENKSKIFYGHIIVIVSSLTLVIIHGIANTYGVFFNSLKVVFNSDRATISGIGSLAFFMEGLYAVPLGRLADRFGPRLIMTVCGIFLCIGYLLMSQASTLQQLYLFYPFIAGLGIAGGNVVLLSTVTRWFVKRRGLMTGVVKVGTGAGIFIFPLVASWLISDYGWRYAYIVLSIVGVIGIVGMAQFLRRDPNQMGLNPFGVLDTNKNTQELGTTLHLGLRDTMRTSQFWAICVAYFFAWYATQSVMIHIVAHAQDNGFVFTQAASIVSVIGATSIAGRIAMGGVGDKLGNKRALMICFSILLVALSWLQLAGEPWMFYLFAVLYGFAHGGFFAIMSPIVSELFGTESHGVNFGMILFLGQIGGAIGPVVTGRLFDINGNYDMAFLILIITSIVALISTAMKVKPVKTSGIRSPI